MNLKFKKLVNSYLKDVHMCLKLFEKKIGNIYPIEAWRKNLITQNGFLLKNIEYKFHGIGCLIRFPDFEIDFDFGPKGRNDGFDLWKLKSYAEHKKNEFPYYVFKKVLDDDFQFAIDENFICQDLKPYSQLFYKSKAWKDDDEDNYKRIEYPTFKMEVNHLVDKRVR